MDLGDLEKRIEFYVSQLDEAARQDLDHRLAELTHAFPFSDFDYKLMYLQHAGVLNFNSYEDLRSIYMTSNPYLGLFAKDPRQFGEDWGESHLLDTQPGFQRPSTDLDADYDGQYDLWLDSIRVGVKATRAIRTEGEGTLIAKAMRHGGDRAFWMNFGQLQLENCDVFVFIGVWVDCLVYWALSREEATSNKYLSHMRRGGIQYQIGINNTNIDEFNDYMVPADEVTNRVRQLGGK